MLRPAPLKNVPRYPITSGVALAAVVVTGMWWSGQDVNSLFMDSHVWSNWELWRAFTSALPHVNLFHLAFNLYWLWVFGSLVERIYGHLKTAVIYLLLAFGSSLAEFTFLSGGVGLSGVGYGLWGMLWVLERHDVRFADCVDRQTNQLFVVWFFLCILLTVTNVMPVANIAHGVGAGMGVLLGYAISGNRSAKWKSVAGLLTVTVLGLLGSTVFWPWVNLSTFAQPEVEQTGLKALQNDDLSRAVKLLEISARMRHAPARAWYNLGVAYQRVGRYDDAATAYQHAAQMPDADPQMEQAAHSFKVFSSFTNSESKEGH